MGATFCIYTNAPTLHLTPELNACI